MIVKLLKKLILGLLSLLLLLTVLLYFHNQSHAPVTVEEVIPSDEHQQIQRASKNFVRIIKDTQTSYAARGAHAKGHACVKAYFEIDEDLDTQLQHGLFHPGKRYKSWIRFSNGSSNIAKSDDGEKDSRGMAIKLLNVEANSSQTQEFLAHNSPAFFSVDLNDYNQLVESEDKIKYFLPSYNPFNWRLREVSHVIDTLAPPPHSPISDEYFSNTAYKLGPHNIKFMVKSCSEPMEEQEKELSDPDFLRNTLVKELNSGSACMQFSIQLQDPTKLMPIEDPSVLWKETDSPFIPVASITILKQKFDSTEQQQFCENLSFSPWNTLEEHRPIGALNRVRKVVYQASSNFRHATNNTAIPNSIDWAD